MSTNVVMEALSPTMEEGRLVEWKKQEGEAVVVGDVLAEVETDKAVMELVARAEGTLLKQVVPAGATVPVSEVVGVIGQPGEQAKQRGGGAAGPESKPEPPKKPAPAASTAEQQATQPAPDRNRPVSMPPAPPTAATEGDGQPVPPAKAPAAAPTGRIRASPLARRMAAERGIDLGTVSGSGPEGRVVARDLEGATTAAAAAPSTPAPLPGGPTAPAYTDTPLSQIRKTIARRLAQSIGPIPTFYLTVDADMERAWEAREALLQAGRRADGQTDGVKVSFNDIIIKAVALALRQHPACNAWWQDDRIRYWNEVHIGMAVAIEEGLITPVIRHADRKSLRDISAEARDLAGRARERRLRPEEYTGSTFSVSNLGMLDIDEFTAVINPPEAGILAVGRITPRPVAHEGVAAVRRRMRLTMSCDHRVIDGATGARFLQTLTAMLENPLVMVW